LAQNSVYIFKTKTKMKNITVVVICLFVLAACHRKTVPAKTENVTVVKSNNKTAAPPPPTTITETKPDSTMSVTPAPAATAMIVVDGYGKVLTPQDKLPDQTIKPDYSQIARAFTPQQIANLKARYSLVPPKVLYVPDAYSRKTLRGTYAVYKKKFWYWKKDDGLYYLDEIYYK
jgi:hypothetical protein